MTRCRRQGFQSNHAGGILGGISTGSEIVTRLAVKPTPSIRKEQRTIDVNGEERIISVAGRHDPCIAFRVVPVAEAMLALVLIDALLAQLQYRGFEAGLALTSFVIAEETPAYFIGYRGKREDMRRIFLVCCLLTATLAMAGLCLDPSSDRTGRRELQRLRSLQSR